MKKVAILGYGLEGKSLFSYLKKDKKNQIEILDKKNGENYLDNLDQFDLIYRSPGVPYNLPEIQKVKRKVSSLMKLFFEQAKKKKATIIGITGSVGKTTTATLLYKILKSAKKSAYLAGNIGISPLDSLKKLNAKSIVVMELSSFQLQDMDQSPQVAIVLDIFEEHLDKHKNFKEYISAKSNIARHQNKNDVIIFMRNNINSHKIASLSPAPKIPITLESGRRMGWEIKTPGEHNYKNFMAASIAASLFKVPEKVIKKSIEDFKGIEHRIEFVRNLRGVKYFNNSKATNIGSAIAGIDAFRENKIVLIGGYSKKLNFTPLIERLKNDDVSQAIFFGAAKNELLLLAKKNRLNKISSVPRLQDALTKASRMANDGEIILLSPGTASFDEFKNYEDRGRKFKSWVKKLK